MDEVLILIFCIWSFVKCMDGVGRIFLRLLLTS
nr:MAG TPA: hypothetical protein [Caudoviricetes sp.]